MAYGKRTFLFACGLGTVIVIFGILTLCGIWFPKPGRVGCRIGSRREDYVTK